jgi:hypothetical protein
MSISKLDLRVENILTLGRLVPMWTKAPASGGQFELSTVSFWCVPVPLSWSFGPGSAAPSAQWPRVDRQL